MVGARGVVGMRQVLRAFHASRRLGSRCLLPILEAGALERAHYLGIGPSLACRSHRRPLT